MSPEACLKWLQTQQFTLWPAVAFNIRDDGEIRQAAQWLSATINSAWGQTSEGVADLDAEPGWVYQRPWDDG